MAQPLAIPRKRFGSRTLTLAVAELAAAAVALGAIEIALMYSGVRPPWVVVLFPVSGGIYLAAGIVAWLRRPSNRLGALMCAGGLVWIGAGLSNTPIEELVPAGLILATVPLAIVVHLLLAFPSGRLRTTATRATVLAGYFVCLVLQAPAYLFGPPSLLQVADRAELADAGLWAQRVAGAAVMVVTAVILAGRLRSAAPRQRRVLAPLYVYGIAAVVWVPLTADVGGVFLWGPVALFAAQVFVLAAVPVAFAAVLLRGGFARTGEIEELGEWLGTDAGERPELDEALAEALGDPSLELLFWDAPARGYVNRAGRARALPEDRPDRGVVEVVLADRTVGAIVYDATLIADEELVRAAGRVVALALERERLTAEVLASRERLRVSRARLVEATDAERRRIAHDLHDGLQTRLVLLAVQANGVREDATASSYARARATELQSGVETAIVELRELVQGVLPAALAERGLYSAAEDLADRIPIPIRLHLDSTRAPLPVVVESTGYFVVSEAVANALKHSQARALELRIQRNNGHLEIEVLDDGVGGAGGGGRNGAGLRGMADRVEALDGRLTVDSPPGGGTRVLAEVPCAH